MKNRYLLISVLCTILAACGGSKKPTVVGSESPSLANPQEIAPSISNKESSPFEVQHVEPLQGREWLRKVKVNIPNSSGVAVEKFVQGYWRPFTFTDSKASFEDSDISAVTRYRVNHSIESPEFEGVFDLNLADQKLKLTGDTTYKAYRIVLPAGKILYLEGHRLSLSAEIFKLDGEIGSFETDPGNGAFAGTLYVRTRSIQGIGKVYLKGARGKQGSQGSPGMTRDAAEMSLMIGKDGEVGGVGGRGGNIFIFYDKSFEIPYDFMRSEGGVGGSGGPGGLGGYDAGQTFHQARAHIEGGIYGPSGKPGTLGVDGGSGQILIRKITESFQSNELPVEGDFLRFVKIENIMPFNAGASWIRKLSVQLSKDQAWPIEKRSDGGTWVPAGYTDQAGNYYDRSPEIPTQYRVAKIYVSPLLVPLKDLDLTEVMGTTLKKNESIRAHRVVLRRSETLYLNGFHLNIEATNVHIEGRIEAFADDQGDGLSASSLTVAADTISGSGTIRLNGKAGRAGTQGQQGACYFHRMETRYPQNSVGLRGNDGTSGGRGGDIILHYRQNFTMNSQVISSEGGLGGAAGPGGPGGVNLTEFLDFFHIGPHRYTYAPSGPSGNFGSKGSPGLVIVEKISD